MFWKILTVLSTLIATLLGLKQAGTFDNIQKQDIPIKEPPAIEKVFYGKPSIGRYYIIKENTVTFHRIARSDVKRTSPGAV